MKYRLLLTAMICAVTTFAKGAEGEKFELALPEGFHVQDANKGEFSEHSGDVLVESGVNDKKIVVRVFYSSKLPVADADMPRFLEAMRTSLSNNGIVKVENSKLETHNGRNWGRIELSIPKPQGDIKQIIMITTLQGSPLRIELESPGGNIEDLKAIAKKISEDTKIGLPKK